MDREHAPKTRKAGGASYMPADPLLTAREAAAERGQARSSFWRDVGLGRVPPAIYVTEHRPRWRRSEIIADIEAKRQAKSTEQVAKPADRLVSAFVALREAFELAGLATPLAVVVMEGETAKMAEMLRYHPRLLIEDRLSGSEPSVCGIHVLEGEPDANGGFDAKGD